MKRALFVLAIIFTVLGLDQVLKIWIKLNMYLGQSFNMFGLDWFQIYFTENVGMAFGIEFGQGWGKLMLSLFRILAITGIGVYLYLLIKRKESYILLTSIALIFSGALGNILDSAFYGLFFTQSTPFEIAQYNPTEGYANFLYGRVVDMFYFPLIDTTWPEWMPWLGGSRLRFFQAIFNVADSAVFVGVCLILIFYKRFFGEEKETETIEQTTKQEEVNTTTPLSAINNTSGEQPQRLDIPDLPENLDK